MWSEYFSLWFWVDSDLFACLHGYLSLWFMQIVVIFSLIDIFGYYCWKESACLDSDLFACHLCAWGWAVCISINMQNLAAFWAWDWAVLLLWKYAELYYVLSRAMGCLLWLKYVELCLRFEAWEWAVVFIKIGRTLTALDPGWSISIRVRMRFSQFG